MSLRGSGDFRFDYLAGQIRHSVANRSQPLRRCFGAVLLRRYAVEMDPATRYTLRRNTASIMSIYFFYFVILPTMCTTVFNRPSAYLQCFSNSVSQPGHEVTVSRHIIQASRLNCWNPLWWWTGEQRLPIRSATHLRNKHATMTS